MATSNEKLLPPDNGSVAVDTETTGVGWHDQAFLVTVAWRDESESLVSHAFELDSNTDVSKAKAVLKSRPLVFHNAKFDIQKLLLAGLIDRREVDSDSFGDTEALAHLLDEHRPKKLKTLAKDLLGLETDEDEALKVERRKLKLKKSDGYDKLPRGIVIPYALKDAEFTLQLYERLYPELIEFDDLAGLYRQELELTLALLDMESKGMALDVAYLETTAKTYAGRALECELSIRDTVGREDFNPNSPKQILEAFNDLGVSLNGTDKHELGATDHPLAQAILDLRKLRKIHGTYLLALLSEQRGGIVHPWVRQHGTVTGRAASGAYQGD